MGLLRREAPEQGAEGEATAIAEFWSWWAAEGHDRAAAVFDGGADRRASTDLARDIGRHVDAIGGLAFETGAGRKARHVLVVTAAGNPDLRDRAARWLAAAPPPDDAFEYADTRQPVRNPAGLAIGLEGGRSIDVASTAVAIEEAPGKVHVSLWHEGFADLPDAARGQITFLLLDALLGEAAVEKYIGGVSWAPPGSLPTIPLIDLPEVVARVAGGA